MFTFHFSYNLYSSYSGSLFYIFKLAYKLFSLFEKLWLSQFKTLVLIDDVVKALLAELANPPMSCLKLNTKVPNIIIAAIMIATSFAFLIVKSLDTLMYPLVSF